MIAKTQNRGKEKGFTLIEAAITLFILGVFAVATIKLYTHAQDQEKYSLTRKNMRMIMESLSSHAETYGRLPCPADPSRDDAAFGWEWNITPADTTVAGGRAPVGNCSVLAGDVHGIVPFQTLNLPLETVRDGWGNYFSYAVSPGFTLTNDGNDNSDPFATPDDTNDRVHARCRNRVWVELFDNTNAVKARFCCAVSPAAGGYRDPDTDLDIQLYTDGSAVSPVRTDEADAAPPGEQNYGFMRDEHRDALLRPLIATSNITAPAFILISHGPDGRGAFFGNDTAGQYDPDGSFTRELENWDADRVYFTGPPNLGNTAGNYFDDIVLWLTQDGIMAANGTSSCQYP